VVISLYKAPRTYISRISYHSYHHGKPKGRFDLLFQLNLSNYLALSIARSSLWIILITCSRKSRLSDYMLIEYPYFVYTNAIFHMLAWNTRTTWFELLSGYNPCESSEILKTLAVLCQHLPMHKWTFIPSKTFLTEWSIEQMPFSSTYYIRLVFARSRLWWWVLTSRRKQTDLGSYQTRRRI